MPLINCPECGKEISDKASVCPSCGYPINKENDFKTEKEIPSKDERTRTYRRLLPIIAGIFILAIVFVSALIFIPKIQSFIRINKFNNELSEKISEQFQTENSKIMVSGRYGSKMIVKVDEDSDYAEAILRSSPIMHLVCLDIYQARADLLLEYQKYDEYLTDNLFRAAYDQDITCEYQTPAHKFTVIWTENNDVIFKLDGEIQKY